MSDQTYYLRFNDQEIGPLTLIQIVEMITKREISPDTDIMYAQPGMTEWLPLSNIQPLLLQSIQNSSPEPEANASEDVWLRAIHEVFGPEATIDSVIALLRGKPRLGIHQIKRDEEQSEFEKAGNDGLKHRYGFDGEFLDAKAWETQRIELANGYELLQIAESRLEDLKASGTAAYSEVISLLERALSKGVSEFTQATIHRHLGEIFDHDNAKQKALEHLETAVRLYPKIGVKRRIARLKTELRLCGG